MPLKKGTLYIVSTPIGNLKDITYRAVEILNSVQTIAAEDTRHTKILLNRYDIETKMISYFEHNRGLRIPQIINQLESGNDIALVTDAGTPGISDPAYKLIRSAIQNDIKIESIPGPSAFLSALVVSGLPTDRFLFIGFLPPKKGRMKKLLELVSMEATLIFYENPKKIVKTLSDIAEYIGDRPTVVCRELTKIHEEIIRGTTTDLISYFNENICRGECVILIGKSKENVYFN